MALTNLDRRGRTGGRSRPPDVMQKMRDLEIRVRDLADNLELVEERLGGVARTGSRHSANLGARLAALEARLQTLEQGRSQQKIDVGALSAVVTREAIPPVLRAIDQRLDALLSGGTPPGGFSQQHFKALARQVKRLKETDPLVRLVNSPEFKALLDGKLRGLTDYLEQEAIPRAMKRARAG